ncbi:MAG: hypothetical protein CME70_04235 [Halobacteriovorax sp.]|nr:hypothetical protein [Halobacteriovorax sp.]|tara:strand:+ start:60660 stop:62798 length:2139 start_codon:yes stop_codon:yes gene_type:complete
MKIMISIIFCAFLSVFQSALAKEAFGRPGITPNWATARNVQVGTSFEAEGAKSPLWFTNADGALTEVFFPTIDTGQIKDAQFLVSDGNFFVEEKKETDHKVEVLSSSIVKLINKDKKGRFEISHTFFTLENSPILVDEIEVKSFKDGIRYYHLTNPHINNTGYKDSAFTREGAFLVKQGSTGLKIQSTVGFKQMSVGFVGKSDGWQDISKNKKMTYNFTSARDGNIATTGEINIPAKKGTYKFYIVYTFSENIEQSSDKLKNAYEVEKKKYETSWEKYISSLKTPKGLSDRELLLYKRSIYTLKVHEDKRVRGALIASLSIPWGEQQTEQPGNKIGGYHLIWPRDHYHVAIAMLHSGDHVTAMNALRFLKKIQYKKHSGAWDLGPRYILKEGAFPQNTWVSGEEYWGGLQLDQVGYPIHLFYQTFLKVSPKQRIEMLNEFGDMLKKALSFILKYGPWTQQERWEENFGISPSSFSVATSALYLGSRLFPGTKLGEKSRNTANQWLYTPGDNIDTWTFTTNGRYGDGQYYLRIAGGSSFGATWNPNDRSETHIANSSRRVEQSLILDQGFMKLALMGLKPANDWKIQKTKSLVDKHISVVTPKGRGWYRYSFDAYGEEGKGRLWPLLSGEHGRMAIEQFFDKTLSWQETLKKTRPIVDSYLGFANDGLMIPEQVFESNGVGTGAATPLAWSHAEYVKLLWSLDKKKNVENVIE